MPQDGPVAIRPDGATDHGEGAWRGPRPPEQGGEREAGEPVADAALPDAGARPSAAQAIQLISVREVRAGDTREIGYMKTPFAEHEGRLYVTIQASGIHWLIPFMDGMTIARFSGRKKSYIRLDDAIAWHENEIEQSYGASGSKKALALLKQARERLVASGAVNGTQALARGETATQGEAEQRSRLTTQ